MKKIVISLTVTGILLLFAGVTGLFLDKKNVDNRIESGFSLEELTENVEIFLADSNEMLEISLIYGFESSDPYFLIIERDTGVGAMELRANIQTGQIYIDGSITRRWNVKYMQPMRNHRIIDLSIISNDYRNNDNLLSNTEAITIAKSYLAQHTDKILINQNHHEFYGYYAFHLLKDGKTVGILRVNSLNGLVSITRYPEIVVEVNQ